MRTRSKKNDEEEEGKRRRRSKVVFERDEIGIGIALEGLRFDLRLAQDEASRRR